MSKFEKINLKKSCLPRDYHCKCRFCKKFMGTLIHSDGSKYSALDRKKYYADDGSHIAKTHYAIARYAVQNYAFPDAWVLDPTIGSGTTAVEALNHKCNVVGVDIQYADIAWKNANSSNPFHKKFIIRNMNALEIQFLLSQTDKKFDLVINNPPYSGDMNQTAFGKSGQEYDADPNNLAFLKEKQEYYDKLEFIYKNCIDYLKPNGYFILGVKDMIKNKKPYRLHFYLSKILEKYLTYKGMVLLPHWPRTLFMNTYTKRFPDVKIPLYQTITIFQNGGKKYG